MGIVMELLTVINRDWSPVHGLILHVHKGTLQRALWIPPWNKYDVWGYTVGGRNAHRVLIRGDARPNLTAFIMERGRILSGRSGLAPRSVAEYLETFEIV